MERARKTLVWYVNCSSGDPTYTFKCADINERGGLGTVFPVQLVRLNGDTETFTPLSFPEKTFAFDSLIHIHGRFFQFESDVYKLECEGHLKLFMSLNSPTPYTWCHMSTPNYVILTQGQDHTTVVRLNKQTGVIDVIHPFKHNNHYSYPCNRYHFKDELLLMTYNKEGERYCFKLTSYPLHDLREEAGKVIQSGFKRSDWPRALLGMDGDLPKEVENPNQPEHPFNLLQLTLDCWFNLQLRHFPIPHKKTYSEFINLEDKVIMDCSNQDNSVEEGERGWFHYLVIDKKTAKVDKWSPLINNVSASWNVTALQVPLDDKNTLVTFQSIIDSDAPATTVTTDHPDLANPKLIIMLCETQSWSMSAYQRKSWQRLFALLTQVKDEKVEWCIAECGCQSDEHTCDDDCGWDKIKINSLELGQSSCGMCSSVYPNIQIEGTCYDHRDPHVYNYSGYFQLYDMHRCVGYNTVDTEDTFFPMLDLSVIDQGTSLALRIYIEEDNLNKLDAQIAAATQARQASQASQASK